MNFRAPGAEKYGWTQLGGDCSGGVIAALIALPYGLAARKQAGRSTDDAAATTSAVCLAGWYTAEIGRQPYVIYGLLRTADALSPVPAATLLLTLVTFVCVYTVFGSAFLIFTLRLIRRGPSGLPGHALPAGSLKRALRPAIGGVREYLASRK